MKFKKLFSLSAVACFVLILLAGACRRDPTPSKGQSVSAEQMVEINRELVARDRERIDSYIERKGLKMQSTPTGLLYQIFRDGEGALLAEGALVDLEFSCMLLDGTVCYDSETDGRMTLSIGKSEIPAGLDQGLRMLRYGSEATFILPAYLGYGLIGDGKKIPARAVLVYNITVLVPGR